MPPNTMSSGLIARFLTKKIPAIPSTSGQDPKIKPLLDAMKRVLESGMGLNGDSDAWVNREELAGANSILNRLISNSGEIDPNEGIDFSTPPRPEGLETTGTFSNIFLSWKKVGYINHGYTEIFRSATDDLGTAVVVGRQFNGTLYVDSVDDDATYYYWIRFVSTANVTGPYNLASGTKGKTEPDPTRILEALTGNIAESHLVDVFANDIDLLRNEKIMKVDAYGRVAGIGVTVTDGESGPTEGRVIVYADKFAIVFPNDKGSTSKPTVPFVVGKIEGRNIVGINGALVVDGTISGRSIVAESIAADKLSVLELSAIAAKMGTVVGGTFKTADSPQPRVEQTSIGAFFLWAGSGAKTADNASFFIDKVGNAVFAGELRAANGTFTGTLKGVDGVFEGTVYAENIVGDVIDTLSFSRPKIGDISGGYFAASYEHGGIALEGADLGYAKYGPWVTTESFSIGAARFERTAELYGITYLILAGVIFELKVMVNGIEKKVFSGLIPAPSGFGSPSGIGGITGGGYHESTDIYNMYSVDLPIDIDATIEIKIRAKQGYAGTLNRNVTCYFPITVRKLTVFKTSSEGITYS